MASKEDFLGERKQLIEQNASQVEELHRVYREIDRHRAHWEKLVDHPGEPGVIARQALKGG